MVVPHPAPNWLAGKRGKALRFDGVDDWVKIPVSESLNSTYLNKAEVTLSAWIFPEAGQPEQIASVYAFPEYDDPSRVGYGFGLWDGKPYGRRGGVHAVAPNPVASDTWLHLAQVLTRTSNRLFVDGVEVVSDLGFNHGPANYPISIGAHAEKSATVKHFKGLVDEVRVHARALTVAEVRELMLE
jgi:hypothetical protein